MLPLAPPPGLTDGGVGGASSSADYQSTLGMAQAEPAVLSWEVWPGTATHGNGTLHLQYMCPPASSDPRTVHVRLTDSSAGLSCLVYAYPLSVQVVSGRIPSAVHPPLTVSMDLQ